MDDMDWMDADKVDDMEWMDEDKMDGMDGMDFVDKGRRKRERHKKYFSCENIGVSAILRGFSAISCHTNPDMGGGTLFGGEDGRGKGLQGLQGRQGHYGVP